jgi:hypothetical protein
MKGRIVMTLECVFPDKPAQAVRDRLPNRRLCETVGFQRLAAIYAAKLATLRFQSFTVRCQIDNPRNAGRRELLATRLDATDARAADIAARLFEARAA